MGRSTSELFRLAETVCDSPDAEAELVAELGAAVGEGVLDSVALRRLRVALAHRLKGDEGLYWRGLLDLIASIEIQRAELERRASEDDTMKTEALRALVLELERGPQGPATLSRKLGRDAGGIVKRLAELERAGLVERAEAANDKSRPRALTARGLLLADRHRATWNRDPLMVAKVAACVFADLRGGGRLPTTDLVRMAQRVGETDGLEAIVAAVLEAAELHQVVDRHDDGTAQWLQEGEAPGPDPAAVKPAALKKALKASSLKPEGFLLVGGHREWDQRLRAIDYPPAEVVSPTVIQKRHDLLSVPALVPDHSLADALARSTPGKQWWLLAVVDSGHVTVSRIGLAA